jgi:hypothetical protein
VPQPTTLFHPPPSYQYTALIKKETET